MLFVNLLDYLEMMSMQKYEKPCSTIAIFKSTDVVTTSGGMETTTKATDLNDDDIYDV